jgi:hypothetical protein
VKVLPCANWVVSLAESIATKIWAEARYCFVVASVAPAPIKSDMNAQSAISTQYLRNTRR